MDIVRNETGHDPSASPNASIEAELASLVDVYGLAILQVPDQIRLRLSQACPGAQQQIDAVLSALDADIPQRLRKAHEDERLHGLLPQLVERVEAHGSIDATTASWAVRAWAYALALPTTSLANATSPQEPSKVREFAAVVTPLSRKPSPAVGKGRAGQGADAQVAGDAHPGGGSVDGAVPATVEGTPAAVPFSLEHHEDPAARVEPHWAKPAAPDTDAIVEPTYVAPSIVAPSIVAPAIAPAEEDAPAAGLAAGGVEPRAPLLPEPLRTSRTPSGRRTLVIGATLAMIGLAIFFGVDGARWLSTGTTSAEPPAPRDSSIAAATSQEAKPAPANRATEKPSPRVPTATDATPAPAEAASGGSQAVPVEAARASFAAPETQRPTITRVDVPRVIAGAPFTVAVRVDTGTKDIARVDRKVVGGSALLSRVGSVTPKTGLRRSRNGALLVPFKAIEAPSYATIEFTAVDRNGLRSEPKRATLTVAAAPAIKTSYCTRITCGTVVAIRELDASSSGRPPDRRARVYEVIIRMDDRTIHKATVPEYWATGTWVQMVGGRFVSIRSRPP